MFQIRDRAGARDWLAAFVSDDGGEPGTFAIISLTAVSMPTAMFKNALSRLGQSVTGRAPVGNACSLLNVTFSQRHGRRIMGMTRASPLWCLSIARFVSTS